MLDNNTVVHLFSISKRTWMFYAMFSGCCKPGSLASSSTGRLRNFCSYPPDTTYPSYCMRQNKTWPYGNDSQIHTCAGKEERYHEESNKPEFIKRGDHDAVGILS